jgi:hypothetical protein
LVFPDRNPGEARISEQEARVLWCREVEKRNGYYYAIEAPTTETYIQQSNARKTDRPIRARTDAALYKESRGKLKRVANVEFKSKQPSPQQIQKDVEKLFREQLIGNWFHVLERTNRRSVPCLLNKLCEAFKQSNRDVSGDLTIVFSISEVLGDHQPLSRVFEFRKASGGFEDVVDKFFEAVESDWKKGQPR